MNRSVALIENIHNLACNHLIRNDLQEDLCFALWNPSHGKERFCALIEEVILPIEGDRQVHCNASFNPDYFERASELAQRKKMGLAFMHSHLGPGWQNMSRDDINTENILAPKVKAITGLSLVGMTVGSDGSWSARFWEKVKPKKYQKNWCQTVRVVGSKFLITHAYHLIPRTYNSKKLVRTISAWGEKTQYKISNLTIGIVGAGSVGSIVGETLARLGIHRIKLIDFDNIEEKNLDRTFGATSKDIGKSKVDVLAKHLKKSSTSKRIIIDEVLESICSQEGYKNALDCDILLSCVDRPWPRFVLNYISFVHLIPVIDGGITVRTNNTNTKIIGADWKAQVVCPGRICLECLGQYSPSDVSLEKTGMLEDPSYIAGLPKTHFINNKQNVVAFSLGLASLEIQQFLSFIISPSGIKLSPKIYHFIDGSLEDNDLKKCNENCLFPTLASKGESATIKAITS
jgi:molybdopterin/thiamine biosynthesis adenylyltransferase